MSKEQWLLGLHVLSAFVFVSGAVLAGIFHTVALLRERPSDVAFLLRLTRIGVLTVGVGSLASLGFGAWLTNDLGLDWSDAWLQWSLALWIVGLGLSGLGGWGARKTRSLADRLVAEGDQLSPELKDALTRPIGLALTYASLATMIAIVGLMVWRPG